MADNEILLEEEESSLVILTDENGNDVEFDYLDTIEYQGKEYLVLTPVDDSGDIVILEIQPVDEEYENYVAVEDEAVEEAVYAIFKDRYKDVLNFGN